MSVNTRVFIFLLLALVSHPVLSAESRRWALLIGVNEYTDLTGLTYAGKDMQILAEQLKASGFEENQVVVLHDGAKDVRLRPLRNNIARELELITQRVKKDDTLLIAFSGHGLHVDGKSYFCPTEARDTDPDGTLIAVDSIYQQLERCPAALKIMLVDACRNDPRPPGKKSSKPKEDLKSLGMTFDRPPEGCVVFCSCGPGQISWEDDKLGHGVFMNYFLAGLSGEADANKNGKISLEELFEFSSDKTESFVADKRRDFQRPSRNGPINGKFEFLPSGSKPQPSREPAGLGNSSPVMPASLENPKPSRELASLGNGKTGAVITNGIGIKLVSIPAGKFTMGSPASEPGHEEDENQVDVTLRRDFYLGVTEVTQGQWTSVMGSTPWKRKENVKEGPNYPATYVSWDNAVAFCKKLSEQEGRTYRLPTEAEWEYACRGGSTTAHSLGSNVAQLDDHAWTRTNAWDKGEMYAHLVGGKRANSFGLYDMHGNVFEWCSDWHGGSLSGGVDPQGANSGLFRVLRGGSWGTGADGCRSAERIGRLQFFWASSMGFRVCLQSVR